MFLQILLHKNHILFFLGPCLYCWQQSPSTVRSNLSDKLKQKSENFFFSEKTYLFRSGLGLCPQLLPGAQQGVGSFHPTAEHGLTWYDHELKLLSRQSSLLRPEKQQ